MSADFQISGLAKFTRGLEHIVRNADLGARRFVVEAAAAVERRAKQNASGRPGPNVVTGNLRRSISQGAPVQIGPGIWSCKVGVTSGAPYGQFLETGTRHMPSYAFFHPAVRAVLGSEIPAIAARAWAGLQR